MFENFLKIENWKLKIGSAIVFFFCLYGQASAATLVRPPNNLGLVGYWPMDEGTGTIVNDVSGNKIIGTSTGATWVNGKHNKALNFNGTNQYVSLGVNTVGPKINAATSVTVSVWINPSAYPIGTRTRIFSNLLGGNVTGTFVGLNSTNGNLEFGGRSVVTDSFQSAVSSVIPMNTWTHVTGVFNYSADTIVIYINGRFVSTNNVSFGNNAYTHSIPTVNDAIAVLHDLTEDFTGKIDDVRVYNRALTAAQVAGLYQSGQTTRKQVSNQGLVGYWSLNEGVGSIYNDSSGNRNIGTSTSVATTPSWTTGKHGKALSFDGSDDFVDVGNAASLNPTAITVSAWVNFNALTNDYSAVYSKITNGSTAYHQILVKSNGKLAVYLYGSAPVNYDGAGTQTLTTGRWYHVVFTYSSTGGLVGYVNGVQDAFVSANGPLASNALVDATIGKDTNSGGRIVNGKIDDVRIYNRALSATEVNNLYKQSEAKINSSQNNKLTNGLVGLWSFNGADYNLGSASAEVLDRSGQGNNGDAINDPTPTIGKVGQGLKFDGVGDRVLVANNATLAVTDAISVSSWVKRDTTITSSPQTILSRWGVSNAYWLGYYPGTGSLTFTAYGLTDTTISRTISIEDNAWHLVTGVYDGSNLYLYLDGVQQGAAEPSTGTINATTQTVRIGYDGTGFGAAYWAGILDEVRLYNRALTAAEVKQLYNLGK